MLLLTPRRLFTLFVAIATFIIATSLATDPDLFWHLRTGDYILTNGIPRQDPGFSFTAEGWEWVTHEWLTQILMITIHDHLGGVAGLVVFFAAVVAVGFTLLVMASDGRPYVAGPVTILGCVASSTLIQARPQMFNILFGAWLILVAERVRQGRWSPLWIWSFVPLTALWVNMHGGFILGFAIVAVYIVGDLGELRWRGTNAGRLNPAQLRLFSLAWLAAAAASLINPNTYRMWAYTYETLMSSAMRDIISEWQSPDFHQTKFWPFALMAIALFVAMSLSRLRPSYTDVLFAVGTTFAALQSARNIPIFAIVAVPILSRHLLSLCADKSWFPVVEGSAVEPEPSRRGNLVNWLLLITLSLVAISHSLTRADATPQAVAERFPVTAVDWLEDNGDADRRMFHEYTWGGYLIWRDIPVYIDGRADVYGDEFMYEFSATSKAADSWRDSLAEHDVELIMVRPDGVMRSVLNEASDWDEIYRDDVAIIFEETPSDADPDTDTDTAGT